MQSLPLILTEKSECVAKFRFDSLLENRETTVSRSFWKPVQFSPFLQIFGFAIFSQL